MLSAWGGGLLGEWAALGGKSRAGGAWQEEKAELNLSMANRPSIKTNKKKKLTLTVGGGRVAQGVVGGCRRTTGTCVQQESVLQAPV